jgi:ubiquinol-cytochrome c reductase cytochrome b subunit
VVPAAVLRDPARGPDKFLGVIAMFASIGVLFALPWLDTSKVRSLRYRPQAKVYFWLFV